MLVSCDPRVGSLTSMLMSSASYEPKGMEGETGERPRRCNREARSASPRPLPLTDIRLAFRHLRAAEGPLSQDFFA